jgi:hypothetical protein
MMRYAVTCGAILVVIGTAAVSMPALARERQTKQDGVAACKAACDRYNRTVASQHACYVKCEKYWLCNGSDATADDCRDGRALTLERGHRQPRRPEAAKRGTRVAPANR